MLESFSTIGTISLTTLQAPTLNDRPVGTVANKAIPEPTALLDLMAYYRTVVTVVESTKPGLRNA